MKTPDNLERAIKKNLNFAAGTELHDRILTAALVAAEESRTTSLALAGLSRRRSIMKSPITRVAAAALIVIAALITWSRFGGSTGSVAWGEVVRNIEASPGFIYRMKQTYAQQETGTIELNTVAYGSARYGLRMDGYDDEGKVTTQTYASLRDGAMTSVSHLSRTHTRTVLAGDAMSELANMDPKDAVRQFLSARYTELGRRTIDGVVAEGVEITDSPTVSANFQIDSCVVQLWVAVDTGLPVLVEVNTVGKNGTLKVHTVQDNFQWNVELDASEFEPNIPEDYRAMEVETDGQGRAIYTTTVTKEAHSQVRVELKDNESESHLPRD